MLKSSVEYSTGERLLCITNGKRGMRGGICNAVERYARANNK